MYCLSKLHDGDDNIVFKCTNNQVFVSSMQWESETTNWFYLDMIFCINASIITILVMEKYRIILLLIVERVHLK